MERIQHINPDRLAWCCAERGITPQHLARDVGISSTTIERVMAGGAGLTFSQLSKVAQYFGRGTLFFLETAPLNPDEVHTAAFRTLSNQKPELSPKVKALIERVEWQREVYKDLREELGDPGPLFDPPNFPTRDPRDAARVTRRWLTLDNEADFSAYRAKVEARGILVFRTNGYNGKWQIAKDNPILGFSLYDTECPVIVVKKQRFETRQTFTLMHELGHLLLRRASSIDDEQDLNSREGQEQEANTFAGHALVPDDRLAQIRDADRPAEVSEYDHWLEPYRRAWGVSAEVILRRLRDSGRLRQDRYAAYRDWWVHHAATLQEEDGGVRTYRYREPRHVFGDTFVGTVFDALNGRHITLAKASSYLDSLKIKDLHKLEKHYAGL